VRLRRGLLLFSDSRSFFYTYLVLRLVNQGQLGKQTFTGAVTMLSRRLSV
jgi:hypothetical protein